ncbi:MAG: hexokinase [Clostridiales Family XIII bacterium]|jgi:hexokinase|nr:hexokinase [Clostridiales Family XIII bacterium]
MKDFTIELGLAADAGKMRERVADFDAEMQRGLRGAQSSLRMLPTYLDPDAAMNAAACGRVVAIDAGGTNLRVALADIRENGEADILYRETYPIPGLKREVSAREFFDRVAACLEPVIAKSDRIGFCFSNPAEILPTVDARIITFTKEVKVSGAGGVLIGDALREALKARGLPSEKSVVVLNDTVATQLAAMTEAGAREKYGAYVGLILGTGVNACYAERNENILKDEPLRGKPGATIINTEAGGYDGFPESEPDRRFTRATAEPARQRFEKMSSGAYQCDSLLEWIRFAASKGVFSEDFAVRLKGLARIAHGDVAGFCASPRAGGALAGLCVNATDEAMLRRLTEAFFDRIAFMLAVMLTALLLRSGDAARDAKRPVCISAEGSVFYGEKLLRDRLDRYMESCARAGFGLRYRFARVEHATIRGAAVAGLAGGL